MNSSLNKVQIPTGTFLDSTEKIKKVSKYLENILIETSHSDERNLKIVEIFLETLTKVFSLKDDNFPDFSCDEDCYYGLEEFKAGFLRCLENKNTLAFLLEELMVANYVSENFAPQKEIFPFVFKTIPEALYFLFLNAIEVAAE